MFFQGGCGGATSRSLFHLETFYSTLYTGFMGNPFNFVSWNVKGLNHPVKRKKIFPHLKQLKTDIVFLQETYVHSSDNSRLKACWAGQHFHSTFQAKARGVSILVAKHISFEPNNVTADKNGRFVIVSGKLFNTKVILANVYNLNVDDASFFDRVFSLLQDLDTHFLILGGDFNWLDPALDRFSSRPGAVSKSALCIQSFLSEFGVSDIWRDRQYSFFSTAHHSYSRIDYIFIDNRLIPQVFSYIPRYRYIWPHPCSNGTVSP